MTGHFLGRYCRRYHAIKLQSSVFIFKRQSISLRIKSASTHTPAYLWYPANYKNKVDGTIPIDLTSSWRIPNISHHRHWSATNDPNTPQSPDVTLQYTLWVMYSTNKLFAHGQNEELSKVWSSPARQIATPVSRLWYGGADLQPRHRTVASSFSRWSISTSQVTMRLMMFPVRA